MDACGRHKKKLHKPCGRFGPQIDISGTHDAFSVILLSRRGFRVASDPEARPALLMHLIPTPMFILLSQNSGGLVQLFSYRGT